VSRTSRLLMVVTTHVAVTVTITPANAQAHKRRNHLSFGLNLSTDPPGLRTSARDRRSLWMISW
jgi:hypothetical protein